MELQRLDKYELQERLGRGGMGEVWKARDTQLQRYVAIKLLQSNLQDNPDFITHFQREAQFIASLRHPNIVQVHDFQFTEIAGSGATAYMVMDYVEGGTLADYIRNTSRKGLFPAATDIVYIFTAISLALDYAHERGMIHRDIKPANILLDKHIPTGRSIGQPILTDFGIARWQSAGITTFTRAAIGTPLYTSPEQARGLAVDERSDLYSLGIILYEMVTGVTPFRGSSPVAIIMQHIQEMPTPPALINPNIPPALSAVVLKSIAKEPQDRFQTASAMTIALAEALGLPIPAALDKSRVMNEQSNYNPLQPTNLLPGMTPQSPPTASPPLLFTPTSVSYPEAQRFLQGHLTPKISDQQSEHLHSQARSMQSAPSGDLNVSSSYTSPVDRAVQTPSLPSLPMPPARRSRKSLYIALTVGAILLLIGLSVFFVLPKLSSKQVIGPPNLSNGVVGNITFIKGPNAPANTFNQLQIDLENISPPPAGKVYYAWLENSNEASVFPNWQLSVSKGAVHARFSGAAQQGDLLTASSLFLVTEEDAGSSPLIPIPDPSAHLYYALISHTSLASPIFEVRQCPSNSINNAANPCR